MKSNLELHKGTSNMVQQKKKRGGGASCILILVGERRRAWHGAEGNSLMIKHHLQYNQMHEQICVDTGTCQAVVHAECDNTGLHSQYASGLRQEGCEFKVT